LQAPAAALLLSAQPPPASQTSLWSHLHSTAADLPDDWVKIKAITYLLRSTDSDTDAL
jgi:hypothetical protein